jgi:hypothetical protein
MSPFLSKSLAANNKKRNKNIIINSFIYFVIAYYIVAFSANLFIVLLAKIVGFDAEFYFNGFRLSGKEWTVDTIIFLYFFGNLFSLFLAYFAHRKYRKQRRFRNKINLLYLWMYILAMCWFFGELIVGAIFNTGMSSAFIAFQLPYFLRILMAFIGIFILIYSGYQVQKQVIISAHLYHTELQASEVKIFLSNQIFKPALLGLAVIFLLKLPHIGQYHYVDIITLLTIGFMIVGLFIRSKSEFSIRFKSRNGDFYEPDFSISKTLVIAVFMCLALLRISFAGGISF